MSREVGNILGYALMAVGLLGFLIMAVAFGRLFRVAWRSLDRKAQIKRVLTIQPRKNQEWPNNTREADMIGCGAGLGVFFFLTLFIVAFLVR